MIDTKNMNDFMQKKSNEAGFTIVEVVIALVIIGILGGLAVGVLTRHLDNAHVVTAQDFLGSKAPRAILACSGANAVVTSCDSGTLVNDWGLNIQTPTQELWSSVAGHFGVTITYPFARISDSSTTISRVINYLNGANIGNASSVSGASPSIVIYYEVR